MGDENNNKISQEVECVTRDRQGEKTCFLICDQAGGVN